MTGVPTEAQAAKVLLAHQLFYDEHEDANECGCGERAPTEFIENYPADWEAPNTPDAAWWSGHVAAVLASTVLRPLTEERDALAARLRGLTIQHETASANLKNASALIATLREEIDRAHHFGTDSGL